MPIEINGTGSIVGVDSLSTPAVTNAAGSASAPSITFTGDSNTGIYSPAADTIAFTEGGVESVRIDSSGRVGIGTTSAGGILHTLTTGSDNVNFFERASGAKFGIYNSSVNSYIGTFSNHDLRLATNDTERARIDTSGRLLVGTSTALSGGANAQYARLQVLGNSFSSSSGAVFALARGQTASSIANGENIGVISFSDNAGATFGEILCAADANTGASDFPGRLVFSTTADGTSSPTERMRITQAGYTRAAANAATTLNYGHEFADNSVDTITFSVNQRNTSFAQGGGGMLLVNCARAANSAYTFLGVYSGDLGDREFNLRGDGNAFADSTWTGGGADYAEYFEWSDSNPTAEDRRGISVVLDGDKIREAQAGEDPIGVISGNPSVVGDAAWNKWSGKYLRDEFGTYVLEDYEVTDEDGNNIIQQRRKLNPAYDPDQPYQSREERPEWDCVGLMGKLRIRKGQVTGSRWIKMRNISDSVEEWLVR